MVQRINFLELPGARPFEAQNALITYLNEKGGGDTLLATTGTEVERKLTGAYLQTSEYRASQAPTPQVPVQAINHHITDTLNAYAVQQGYEGRTLQNPYAVLKELGRPQFVSAILKIAGVDEPDFASPDAHNDWTMCASVSDSKTRAPFTTSIDYGFMNEGNFTKLLDVGVSDLQLYAGNGCWEDRTAFDPPANLAHVSGIVEAVMADAQQIRTMIFPDGLPQNNLM